MNDRALSLLGLCRRAGRTVIGADTVCAAITDGSAVLVLAAKDLSKNSLKQIEKAAEKNGVPLLRVTYTKDELSYALGKYCGALCITDKGFADKIRSLLSTISDTTIN